MTHKLLIVSTSSINIIVTPEYKEPDIFYDLAD